MKQDYIFQCETCKERFRVGEDAVKVNYDVHHKTKDGRSMWLTYYDCPWCDRRHYVQIDDTRSRQIKKETLFVFRKLSKKRLNYEDIPKSQNERFKKLNKKLEEYRLELKKELNGSEFVTDEGTTVEVHFSV